MKNWTRWMPLALVAVFALWIAGSMAPARDKTPWHTTDFGRLPVLLNGRVQPLDSVARNTLLLLRGDQSVPGDDARILTPSEWLLEVLMKPAVADQRKVIRIHHPELVTLLSLEKGGLNYYSFKQLQPHLKTIEEQGRNIGPIKAELRTPYQKSLMSLNEALHFYLRLKISLQPNHLRADLKDFATELAGFEQAIPAGFAAIKLQQQGQKYDEEAFNRLINYVEPYDIMAKQAYPLMVPAARPGRADEAWLNVGRSLLDSVRSGEVHPAIKYYAAMSAAYNQSRPDEFNRALGDYQRWLVERAPADVRKGGQEAFFNHFQPFYKSMIVYVAAFLFAISSWLNMSRTMNRTAFYLMGLAFLVHTSGLIFRMYLEGRPPVTNLYSSAIFVGWGAVLLGIILERIFRDGIGAVVASSIGFITLIIAHHLSMAGDTMEMLQAVLDTNLWLSTHVVMMTTGYASTFVAGFLAILYVVRGVFTRTLEAATGKSLARMIYGIICFATLCSFVGTILGGIWADQSWGRFWGWDPKENGALLIVLWNALILHVKWGGFVRERGLANLAIFGNVITSFSWFGVNMLGIGLHSYGFMDQAFYWLTLFISTQLALIGFGLLPARHWRSPQNPPQPPSSGTPTSTPLKPSRQPKLKPA